MKTYMAVVERDGKWWMVSIPEIDGLTQARTLAESQKMASSLIAITLDIPVDAFNVTLDVRHVGKVFDVSSKVATIKAMREQAAEKERQAGVNAAALAKQLAAEGLTVRDIGSVFDVSFQRAHQMVNA